MKSSLVVNAGGLASSPPASSASSVVRRGSAYESSRAAAQAQAQAQAQTQTQAPAKSAAARLARLQQTPQKRAHRSFSDLRHLYAAAPPASPSRTPSALLHNDWYLNQLIDEVAELYRPGTLSGLPLSSKPPVIQRPLTLLRELVPIYKNWLLYPRLKRAPDCSDTSSLAEGVSQSPGTFHSSMPPKRKPKGAAAAAAAAKSKAATGRGKRDVWNDESRLFSSKSKLAGRDLTQFFASPLAWSSLSEEQQQHVRELLPPGIEYDESGAPAQSYLRYDPGWRTHLRLFSEDLEAGRLEPAWLEAAERASAERRRGDFDAWKEEQFEQFWGEKSDAHADLLAGEAIKIRFGEMVSAGEFRPGDVFIYSRTFGKGKDSFAVEKHAAVIGASASALTLTVAPGTTREPQHLVLPAPAVKDTDTTHQDYLSAASVEPESSIRLAQPDNKFSVLNASSRPYPANKDAADDQPVGSIAKCLKAPPHQNGMTIVLNTAAAGLNDDSDSTLSELNIDENHDLDDLPPPWLKGDSNNATHVPIRKPLPSRPSSSTTDASRERSGSPEKSALRRRPVPKYSNSVQTVSIGGIGDEAVISTSSSMPPASQATKKDGCLELSALEQPLVTISDISSLITLEMKLLEIDGRVKGKPNASGWRGFRCQRDGKDRGTLWTMRQQYHKNRYG